MRQSRARKATCAILEASRQWDPATMKISPTGEVTAEKDPTKTGRGERDQYIIDCAAEALRETGQIVR